MTDSGNLVPPWRQRLVRSLHVSRAKAEAKYVQLASYDPKTGVANRTVVFRGFITQTNNLAFVTDWRSDKVQQLDGDKRCELCWYFTKTREQFRIKCFANIHNVDSSEQALRRYYWQQLSDKAKQGFYAPSPKTAYQAASEAVQERGSEIAQSFVLLSLSPIEVDYLDLKTSPHTRIIYLEENRWQAQRVNA